MLFNAFALKVTSCNFSAQNFFVQSSALLYGATENTVQFSSLLIEVPTTWTDCSMVSTASTRIPRAAADVIIKDGVAETVRAVQPEGCGVKGRRVEMDLAATANSEQVLIWYYSGHIKNLIVIVG